MTSLAWIGTNGSWQAAGNWNDLSDGTDPSLVPPGSGDVAVIAGPSGGFETIDGAGNAASLGLSGDIAIGGSLGIGTLALAGGTLAIAAGTTLSAVLSTIAGTVAGSGGLFTTAGTLTLNANIAGLSLTGGAVVQAGGLVMAATNTYLSVDAASTLQIGAGSATTGGLTVNAGATLGVSNSSTAFAAAILGAVIANGRIAAAALDFGNQLFQSGTAAFGPASSLSGSGTIEALAGGAIGFGAGVAAGSLTILADSGATLRFDAPVAAGNSVVLSGSHDVLQIGGADSIAFAPAITGFDASDVLVIAGPTVTAATAAGGTLTLFNGATVVGTLILAAAMTGQDFTASTISAGRTQIVLSGPPGSGTISPGTTAADRYLWTGPLNGDWGTAANWQDLSAGQNPAAVAPGSLDLVTFAGPGSAVQIVSGVGRAASMALSGNVTIAGTLQAGTVAVSSGTLGIAAGATLQAGTATTAALIAVQGNAARFTVDALTLSGSLAQLTAGGGGDIQAGSLLLSGANANVVVDETSTVEIGGTSTAAAGMAVDAGATLQVAAGNAGLPGYLLGAVTVGGLIAADWLDFGNQLFQPGLAGFGPASRLGGSGTVEALTGGTVEFGAPIVGSSLTLLADRGATLRFDGSVAAGAGVILAGGNMVQIGAAGAVTLAGFAAGIAGFDISDTLLVTGAAIDSADASPGTLNLRSGGSLVATLALDGNYSAAGFTVIPVSATQAQIRLADQTGTLEPGAGTTGDVFQWIGPLSGDWGADANWRDLTAGQSPAGIAPGRLDDVGIASPGTDALTVTGVGNAGRLALSGDIALAGLFNAGSVTATGSVAIAAGDALLAGAMQATADLAVAGTLTGSATLTLSGSAHIAAGGSAAFAAVLLNGGTLDVDLAAEMEIGNLGGAASGALTVDAGAGITASGADDAILGAVVDNGLISGLHLAFGGGLAGSGVVAIAAGGTVGFDGAVAAGPTIQLSGGGVLQIGSVGAAALPGFAAGITGLDATDALLLNGASIDAADPGAGVLVLRDGTAIVGTLALAGALAGQSFVTTPLGPGESRIARSAQSSTGGISPGTDGPAAYLWTGALTGDWNLAMNWQADGGAAIVAPGSLDDVTYDTGGGGLQFIRGIGAADALALDGANAVTGRFRANSLAITGSLAVAAGASLAAATAELTGTIAVDAAGTLEIGTAGTAEAGALTVDQGATLAVTGVDPAAADQLVGAVIDNGLITATYLMAAGAISGSGGVAVQPGGTVAFGSAVAAGITVTLAGSGDVLALGGAGATGFPDFASEILGFDLGDALLINGPSIDTAVASGGTLTLSERGAPVGQLSVAGQFALRRFLAQPAGEGQTRITAVSTACFVAGSRIRTPEGDVAVEALRPGRRVCLAGGGTAEIVWLGHRRLECHGHPRPQDVLPVRVRAGAFGLGRPARDLRLSPDHAIFAGGVLIPVRYLLNGRTIRQETAEVITYHHVELAEHAVLLAENLPCESYLDTGNRAAFANGGGTVMLHPDFARDRWVGAACAPLVTAGSRLAGVRAALLREAARFGHHATDVADPYLLIDGRRIDARRSGASFRFALPCGATAGRLISRIFTPAHTVPGSADHRTLGVAVARLRLDGRAPEPRQLGHGWLADGWTDGSAFIALAGARELAFDLAGVGRYWRPKRQGRAAATAA